MTEHHLSNDEFMTRLSVLFTTRREKGHGTVHVTQKRLTYPLDQVASKTSEDPLWDTRLDSPVPILVRASDGGPKEREHVDKIKLSTIVQHDDIDAFFARYLDTCKAGMSALKKRDRTKRKKDKAKKKKALAAEVDKKG